MNRKQQCCQYLEVHTSKLRLNHYKGADVRTGKLLDID